MKSGVICAFLALLCGCAATYRQSPWAGCIYAGGHAYVMQGTETIKTANLFTVHGTFKKFSFPVKREFRLLEKGDSYKEVGRFVQKGNDCTFSHYQFFPEFNTLLSLEDFDSRLQNLTRRKSFRVDGTFLEIDKNQSRFCLVKNFERDRLSRVDKVTGQSVRLTKVSENFVGEHWHVNVFISPDGHRITRVEQVKREVIISAWDLQKEVLLLEPHTVAFPDLKEINVILAEVGDDSVLLAVSDSDANFGFASRGKISIKRFTSPSFTLQQNIVVEFDGLDPHAIKDAPNALAILFNGTERSSPTRERWGLRRYDLSTGNCVYSDTIELPGQ